MDGRRPQVLVLRWVSSSSAGPEWEPSPVPRHGSCACLDFRLLWFPSLSPTYPPTPTPVDKMPLPVGGLGSPPTQVLHSVSSVL